jgi:hypothetical protein
MGVQLVHLLVLGENSKVLGLCLLQARIQLLLRPQKLSGELVARATHFFHFLHFLQSLLVLNTLVLQFLAKSFLVA